MNEDLKDIIPKSWEVERLGDFVITEKGKKPKNISNEYNDICHLPYVNIKAFEKNIIDEYTDGLSCVLCEEGDFVMVWDGSRSGYVGKAIKGALGSTLVRIKFPGIYLDYAYYFLQSKYLEINTRVKGVGIPHVDPALLWNYHFPIPPFPEQHRIVAKIEELFSSLDKGIESLKTAQQQLRVYRQAVLKWAFEGKLTNKNVVEGELPMGWKWVKIIEVADSMKNGLYKPANVYSSDGIACLRMYNIEGGKIHWFDIKRMILNEKDIKEYQLIEGDLLVNRVNSRELVGKTAYINKFDEPVVYESKNIRLRLKKGNSGEYLNYWFLLSSNKYFTSNAQQTVGMASTNQKQLGDFEFPLPPTLEEQHTVVAEIESRLSVCDKMEESIEHSLKQSEALRQSILKKAFEGKLVPQDPNDEPASVLLDRIKGEREKNKSETPPRRRAGIAKMKRQNHEERNQDEEAP